MTPSMVKRSPLDSRDTSRIAWARYRVLMLGMGIVSIIAVILALLYLHFTLPHGLNIHMIIATTAGVGLSVMLGGALMGLVFLSSGSGHDEAIEDVFENDPEMKNDR